MNTRVSKETLDTINRTSIPLQDGSGEYWVNFNVFHNLHCLVSDSVLLYWFELIAA